MQVSGGERGFVDGLGEGQVNAVHRRGLHASGNAGDAEDGGRDVIDNCVLEGVAAGRVEVEQLDQILQRGTGLTRFPGAVGTPDHAADGQHFAVRPRHRHQLIARQRIWCHQVRPSGLHAGRDRAAERAAAHHHAGGLGHRGLAAGRQIQGVGQVAVVGHIVDQVVGDVVVRRRADHQRACQLVNLHRVDQRGAQIAVVVQVLKAGREVLELALQARQQVPLRGDGGARGDIAQVDRQRVAAGMGTHLRADDLEVDQQALLVFDDLGLGRTDAQVGRPALADIDHLQAKRKRLRRLDLIGERVVADDVALPEVIEIELGLGIDGDARGQQRHVDDGATFVVVQRAAHAVDRGDVGRGLVGGHKGVINLADGAGRDRPMPVGVHRQVGGGGAAHHELAIGVIAVGVADVQRQCDVGQCRVAAAVVQLQRALEGRAGDDRLLLDAQAHLGTHPRTRCGAQPASSAAAAAGGWPASHLRGVVANWHRPG